MNSVSFASYAELEKINKKYSKEHFNLPFEVTKAIEIKYKKDGIKKIMLSMMNAKIYDNFVVYTLMKDSDLGTILINLTVDLENMSQSFIGYSCNSMRFPVLGINIF